MATLESFASITTAIRANTTKTLSAIGSNIDPSLETKFNFRASTPSK